MYIGTCEMKIDPVPGSAKGTKLSCITVTLLDSGHDAYKVKSF